MKTVEICECVSWTDRVLLLLRDVEPCSQHYPWRSGGSYS